MVVAEPGDAGTALKLSQFFRYAADDGRRRAQIWMPSSAVLTADSPWRALLQRGWVKPQPHPQPGLLLLSDAADWQAAQRLYGDSPSLPRLQLIWGSDLRCWGHGALKRPAIRAALGSSVAAALPRQVRLLEPLHRLPLGLDPEDLPSAPSSNREGRVLILAGNRPALGLAVQQQLQGHGVTSRCELALWPMLQWQQALAEAELVVLLAPPVHQPSLGLRRLAAMALNTLLVCQARADDDLCRDGRNALVCPEDPRALAEAALSLLEPAASGLRRQLLDGARATLVRHRRALERLAFEQLLDQLADHWQQACRCHA